MFALGAGVYFASDFYQPAPAVIQYETPAFLPEAPAETAALPHASFAKKATPSEIRYQPSPTKLNLAHYFREGADGNDITKSYAGDIFGILTIQDENWVSGIYDYSDYAPINLAARLGRSKEQVLGRYNPKDSLHDPITPNTWTVNSFKNIRIQATDGDGNPISVYSNVIEIMSMANVYAYYMGTEDYDLILNYAKDLWKASHSYSVTMSDVYYCSGCMDEEAKQRERDALEAAARMEEQQAAAKENGDAAGSASQDRNAGPSGEYETPPVKNTGSPVYVSGRGRSAEKESQTAETTPADDSGRYADNTSAYAVNDETHAEASRTHTGNTESVAADAGADAANAGTDAAGAGADAAGAGADRADAESIPADGGANAEGSETQANGVETAHETGTETGSETYSGTGMEANSDTAPEQSSGSPVIYANIPDAAESDGADGTKGPAAEEPAAGGSADENTAAGRIASAANASVGNNDSSRTDQDSEEKTDCPGHIDLIINMKICGLKESKGLYALDTAGNSKKNIAKAGWPGWNEETKAYVINLSKQDWYKNYGLSVSVYSMSNSLTMAEINSYMEQLPGDLSPVRRRLIYFALSSVGRVPYYWGGKASRPDYDGNHFGSVIAPDTKGRVLKGLDCSGWIGWVYWSVTGERLPYESTSGLAVCGTGIDRKSLQPGDIILHTGDDAHVIMFLGWTDDGRIQCIHETSGSVNNVTVAVRDANWPYYRKLVD